MAKLTKAKYKLAHPESTFTDWIKYRYIGLRHEEGYTITLTVGEHGTCVADTLKISTSGRVEFKVTPDEEYAADVTVTNAQSTRIVNNTFKVRNPTGDVTVAVTFTGVR